MKALIHTAQVATRVTSWNTLPDGNGYSPEREIVSNSAKIIQIEENEFDVNPTELLWADCNTSVTVNDYYYDTSDSTIKPLNHVPQPSS